MEQQPGTGNIQIEHAFNEATQLAIGDGAQVSAGAQGEQRQPDAAARPPGRSGSITITHSFNGASAIALGQAQVHLTADAARRQESASRPLAGSTHTGKVFISYSPEDQRWCNLLQTHLAPLASQHVLEIWTRAGIGVGRLREQTIATMLAGADVAVLLVSAHYLASEVIEREELACILARHAQGQLSLLPLVVAPCLYQERLGAYEAFNAARRPLATLALARVEDILVQVARTIQQLLECSRG